MSRPRGVRTGDENPASMTIFANASIASGRLVSNRLPGHGLNGIRFTLAGMPAISRTSSRASPRAVVHALQHHVFERDPPRVAGRRVAPAGGDQLRDRIFAVERHQLVAQLVAHRVQRHREIDAELRAGAVHHRHHAGGGQRDAPPRQADALVVHHDGHRLGDVLVIVQRLAHAHQHDGREQARRLAFRARPLAVAVARRHELADDLGGAQVAHQRLRAGVAEPAGQRAADLRGDADRAAILVPVGDVDGLRLLAVAEAEQEFAGVVGARLLGRDLGPPDHEPLREALLQRLRDRGHRARNR